jgi:hypothetical protein
MDPDYFDLIVKKNARNNALVDPSLKRALDDVYVLADGATLFENEQVSQVPVLEISPVPDGVLSSVVDLTFSCKREIKLVTLHATGRDQEDIIILCGEKELYRRTTKTDGTIVFDASENKVSSSHVLVLSIDLSPSHPTPPFMESRHLRTDSIPKRYNRHFCLRLCRQLTQNSTPPTAFRHIPLGAIEVCIMDNMLVVISKHPRPPKIWNPQTVNSTNLLQDPRIYAKH